MGRRRRRRHKSYSKMLLLLLSLIILIIIIVNNTFAKYSSTGASDATVDVAFFLVEEKLFTEDISLTEMIPGSEYIYTYSIANYNEEGKRAQIALEYEVTIRMTTNLPLVYELYENDSTINLITAENTVTDSNGTYFITKKFNKEYFGFTENQKNIYTLKVRFPSVYKTSDYQGIIDAIELTIDAKQRR